MPAILCYVTCADRDEAITIGRTLVEERLAAAANVLGDTVSIYRWDETLHEKPYDVAKTLRMFEAANRGLADPDH